MDSFNPKRGIKYSLCFNHCGDNACLGKYADGKNETVQIELIKYPDLV